MTPAQISTSLRHIASKIDASTNPFLDLVLEDLSRLCDAIDQSEELEAPPFGKGGGRWKGQKPDGMGPRQMGPQTGLGLGPCRKEMTPVQLSSELRRIAVKIDRSMTPSFMLVANDIRRLVAVMADDPEFASVRELIKKLSDAVETKSEGELEALLEEEKALARLTRFLRRRESEALKSGAK